MCLTTVTKTFAMPQKRVRWAWKELYPLPTGYALPAYYLRNEQWLETDKWYQAEIRMASTGAAPHDVYDSGFHVFVRESPPGDHYFLKSVCIRVRVRGIRIIGTQGTREAWVADELYIPGPKSIYKPPEKRKHGTRKTAS